jgi:23S rRNA (cytosine1962-C5)-methyltransferase
VFDSRDYRLIDFGNGRKLEWFSGRLLDRPSPAAEGIRCACADRWSQATLRFERGPQGSGRWMPADMDAQDWILAHGALRFELRLTPFGHLGVFPEQATNWDWLTQRLNDGPPSPRVLNLFAYTGGSTIAAAAAGARVVHVDAARNVVAWARRNAEASGLAEAPIRWIVEDSRRFVQRERKRGNRYEAIVLDPPSYGHGVGGRTWKIDRHLPPLLADCAALLADTAGMLLLTAHSPGWEPPQLRRHLVGSHPRIQKQRVEALPLTLQSEDGRRLSSGAVARWFDG